MPLDKIEVLNQRTRYSKSDFLGAIVSPLVVAATACLMIATEAGDEEKTATFVVERLTQDVDLPVGAFIVIGVAAIAAISVIRKEWLPRVTVGCVLGSVLLIVGLHVLEPGNRPFDYVMSTYAFTSHAYLIGPAMLLASAAKLAVGHHLYEVRRTVVSFIALLLLACSAGGGVIAATYTMEVPVETLSGRLHIIGSLLMFLPFDAVAVIMTLAMGKATFSKFLWPLFFIGCVGFVTGMAMMPLVEAGLAGLVQRISVGSSLLWMTIAAFASQSPASDATNLD